MLVDQHQRQMCRTMLEAVEDFTAGSVDLGKLVRDLRGLYVEADPHDPEIRSGFEAVWSSLDGEHELRTESWAPAGAATEESLRIVVTSFTRFVDDVLAADTDGEHR